MSIQNLGPGRKLEAGTTLFWSSSGFAFEVAGKHSIEVRILWNHAGIPYGVKASTDIWVDYPVSDAGNEVASMLLHEEVGTFVTLGSGARHLKEAVSRIEEAISKHPEHPGCKCMLEFEGHRHSRSTKAKVR